MKNNNFNIDEMIDSFQSMSVLELRQIENDSPIVFQNNGEYPVNEFLSDEYSDNMEKLTDAFYNISLAELKNIPTTSINVENLSLEQKVLITGLENWVIIRLETQKENAALKEIITYCEKLNIPFDRFVPEIFSNTMIMK